MFHCHPCWLPSHCLPFTVNITISLAKGPNLCVTFHQNKKNEKGDVEFLFDICQMSLSISFISYDGGICYLTKISGSRLKFNIKYLTTSFTNSFQKGEILNNLYISIKKN